ncbi:hypothetical protein F7725_003716 [Dissostichus mawsoni]|uniref:Fas-binding factor 1 n=1 Tax=Dissostichus mawsoni TaxID=36200 RepID=A0A7J5YEB9_DISMA|nr:hypothetical protein F7725_003716 [Dissostichus mawsoni]
MLDSLFDDEKLPVRGKSTRSGQLNRTSATDNIFSMLAEEVKRDGGDPEDSDVSAADPNDILKNMKMNPPQEGGRHTLHPRPQRITTRNVDDPLADLLDDLLPDETKPEPKSIIQKAKREKATPSPTASPILKTTTSKAATKRSDLTFDDDKEDLMDALGFDGDNKNAPKKKEAALWSNKDRSETPQRPRTKLDEILESLTSPRLLERPPTGEKKEQTQEKPQQDKTFTVKETLPEEDLTFGSYQPTLGSTPEARQSRRHSVRFWLVAILFFCAVANLAVGHHHLSTLTFFSHIRFSTEDVSPSTPEKKPKPSTPISTRQRPSADWLGLKTNDDQIFAEDDAKETSTDSPIPPSSPSLEKRPSLTGSNATLAVKVAADTPTVPATIAKQTQPEVSKSQPKEEEEDDWLAGALSRKKGLSVTHSEAKTSKQEESLGLEEEVDLESTVSKQVASQAPRAREDSLTSVTEANSTFLGQQSPNAHSTPVRETRTRQDYPPQLPRPLPVSTASVSHTQPQSQPHLPPHKGSGILRGPSQAADEMPQLPLLHPTSTTLPGSMWCRCHSQQTFCSSCFYNSSLSCWVSGVNVREQQAGDYQALQARIIQLEGQVKTLQLRASSKPNVASECPAAA